MYVRIFFPHPKAVLDMNLVKLQIVVYGWLQVRSDLDEVSNTHLVSHWWSRTPSPWDEMSFDSHSRPLDLVGECSLNLPPLDLIVYTTTNNCIFHLEWTIEPTTCIGTHICHILWYYPLLGPSQERRKSKLFDFNNYVLYIHLLMCCISLAIFFWCPQSHVISINKIL